MKLPLVKEPGTFPGAPGRVLGAWFLGGMALYLLLMGGMPLLGISLLPLTLFLASLAYLSGGLLAGMYSLTLCGWGALSRTKITVVGVLLVMSVSLLWLGILFGIKAIQSV